MSFFEDDPIKEDSVKIIAKNTQNNDIISFISKWTKYSKIMGYSSLEKC